MFNTMEKRKLFSLVGSIEWTESGEEINLELKFFNLL